MLSWYCNGLGIDNGKDFRAVVALEDNVCYSYPFFILFSLNVKTMDHVDFGASLDFAVL